jgi:tRNA(fMet)-specific endonuclease VapC
MKFVLDTNMCIYVIKNRPPEVIAHFRECEAGDIAVSSITVAELSYGVEKSQKADQNRRALEQFLVPLIIAEFDYDAALAYGRLRPGLEAQGQPIGPLDTLIGAHALSLGLTLVTNNTREFARVPGLQVVNWAES